MARDYARNRTSRRNARTGTITPRGGRRPSSQLGMSLNKGPSRFHTFLSIIIGILIGLIIAGVIYFKHEKQPSALSAQAQEKTTTQNKAEKLKEKIHKKQTISKKESDSTTQNDIESEYLDEEEHASTDASDSSDENTATSTKDSDYKAKKKTAESTQPQYEFYTMLPKDKIDDTTAEKEKTESKNLPSAQYHLQIAAMNKFEDADHLKAQLILQGYNASISKQVRHGSTRYRVLVGPFNSTKAAIAQQQTLKKNHINSILTPA